MARKLDAAATMGDQQTLIQGVAKYFIENVYGPDGTPWGTRFDDMEELCVQIGQMEKDLVDVAVEHLV